MSSQSNGASLARRDHTVLLLSTQHPTPPNHSRYWI